MKHLLLVGSMVVALSSVAAAQGADIHTRCIPNGGQFELAAETPVYNYEATISGCLVAFTATLEVYHNGILKTVATQAVLLPQPEYAFVAPVEMSSWGLKAGDAVTFRLKVVRLGFFGGLLAIHSITGVVPPAEPGPKAE